MVAYQALDGGVYFALQVKPDLPPAASRPRDIQILIDHSASQAGAPLDAARKIAKAVVNAAGDSDRIAVWAVSTPRATRNLVRGGGLASAADARAAFGPLKNEYASGAVDLKDAIDRVAKEFDGKATRQQVILYLGDGESALNPLDEASRYKLAADLHDQNIAFYAIPLGARSTATTFTRSSAHGRRRASPIRREDGGPRSPQSRGWRSASRSRWPCRSWSRSRRRFRPKPPKCIPTKLPPLRSDTPTLVVGRFAKGKAPTKLELTIDGKVRGAAATAKVSHQDADPVGRQFLHRLPGRAMAILQT